MDILNEKKKSGVMMSIDGYMRKHMAIHYW